MIKPAGRQLAQRQHLAFAAVVQRAVKRILQIGALLVDLVNRIAVFPLGFDQAARRPAAFEGIDDSVVEGENLPANSIGWDKSGLATASITADKRST